MAKVIEGPGYGRFWPSTTVLVSSISSDGRPNIMTVGYASIVNAEPPMVGVPIRPERYSHSLILESGEFVVNIPHSSQMEHILYCGTVSGREADKFKESGLTPGPSKEIRTPVIQECPVNLECKVHTVISLGSHDWIIGRIVATQADEELVEGKVKLEWQSMVELVRTR